MTQQTLKEKTAKGLFWGGISSGLQQILGMIFGIVLARLLCPGDYGLVGMLTIFVAIASTIQESGFTTALINKKGNLLRNAGRKQAVTFALMSGSRGCEYRLDWFSLAC